jgi:hypothetical protein
VQEYCQIFLYPTFLHPVFAVITTDWDDDAKDLGFAEKSFIKNARASIT